MGCNCGGQGLEDCGCEGVQTPYIQGANGDPGQNSYELWLAAGNTGTLADFLASQAGQNGLSAYNVAVSEGFVGTVTEWLASLVGAPGIDGGDGLDGVNAYGYVADQFPLPQLPPSGGSVSLVMVTAPGNQTQWPAIGQPIFIQGWGTLKVDADVVGNTLFLTNLGYPENAADGTATFVGAKIVPTGFRGGQGDQGDQGDTIIPDIPVVSAMPVGAPALGQATQIRIDTSVTPNQVWLIRWNGASWADVALLSGAPGAKVMYLNADPNTQPSSYGSDGDTVIDTSIVNLTKFWTRVAPASWTLMTTITGGVSTNTFDMFRVGKSADQPIATGTTTPTLVQFDLMTAPNHSNGGWWSGSGYTAQAGVTTPMRFVLENVRIHRLVGSGETIDFDIDILFKGVSVANGVISITSPATEGELVVLDSGDQVTSATNVVQVTITPSGNPSEQWYVDMNNIVFYNQR